MSFYNMLFGENPRSDVILATLGLTREGVGRFRDAFVANGEIAIYTRNGGGNREHWGYDDTQQEGENCTCPGCIISYRLPKHPNYLRDEDDDFDCTYATIYFSFPEEYAEGLRAMDQDKPFDPDERWDALLTKLREGSKKAAPESR